MSLLVRPSNPQNFDRSGSNPSQRLSDRIVAAAQADEEEHRAEGEQCEHERGSLADADREQPAPDEEGEQERPDERRDARVDARRSQMHWRDRNGFWGAPRFPPPPPPLPPPARRPLI